MKEYEILGVACEKRVTFYGFQKVQFLLVVKSLFSLIQLLFKPDVKRSLRRICNKQHRS